jgi:branched-chain amino acid aminotransferase
VFACGTAAVVTPVNTLRWRGGEVTTGDKIGPVTTRIRQDLLDLQYGRTADTRGWLHRLC